jgi:hypothetical protein
VSGLPAETFPWPVVNQGDSKGQFAFSDLGKIRSLREEFAKKAVGVFISAPLPSPQYTPEQPESKEQLIQGLNTVIDRMKEIMPKLEKAATRLALYPLLM